LEKAVDVAGFCLEIENETKSTALLIEAFVLKLKTRQKAPHC